MGATVDTDSDADATVDPAGSLSVRTRLTRALELALALELTGGVVLFFAVAAKMLLYPHEVVVTEGAIGLAVRSVLDGVPLYDPVRWRTEPFVIVHYTPLYYLVTGAVVWTTRAGLFLPGRLVSILATVGTGALAALFVRRETGNRWAPALVAGGLWFSFYHVVFWGTAQRVDALGILFEAAGLIAFVAARKAGRTGYGAIPWFVAAWATKQVMLVGLLAACATLLLDAGWRKAVRFAAAGFGAIAVIFAGLMLWSGGGFWTATVLGTVSSKADTPWVIFSNAELFFGSPWNMLLLVLATWAGWTGVHTGTSALSGSEGKDRAALQDDTSVRTSETSRSEEDLAEGERDPGESTHGAPRSNRLHTPALFLCLYLWIGLVLAIATDANLPRFFPPMLAMAILVAWRLDAARGDENLRAALLFALVLTFASHALYEMRSLVRERLLTLDEHSERLLFARAVERNTPGRTPVLAQDVGMALSAGRSVALADPYVFSILAGNGAWRPDVLEGGIRSRRYEAVVLNRPLESLDPHEWTTLWISPAKQALLENYRLAETVTIQREWRFLEPTRYIYVPRE